MTLDEFDDVVIQTEESLDDDSDEVSMFATVYRVTSSGLQLTFDGETEPSTKVYKCLRRKPYTAGDRVLVIKDSGTYVVIGSLGEPAAVQTLSTSLKNMGYTAATSSNYLTILDNVVGILKKYGLLNT